MMASESHFSASVRLSLRIGDRELDVWSVGPDEIILREWQAIEPCDATVLMWVDGSEFAWPVRLPHGTVPQETEVPIILLGPMIRKSSGGACG